MLPVAIVVATGVVECYRLHTVLWNILAKTVFWGGDFSEQFFPDLDSTRLSAGL